MSPKSRAIYRPIRTALIVFASLLIVSFALGPFYWVLTVSLTPEGAFSREVRLFPSSLTLDNYINLFDVLPFAKYFRNSAVVACSTVVLTLLIAIPAAYGFARFRFRGRRLLLTGLLLLYLIPPVVLLVPLLIIFKNFGLVNTYQGLILAEASSTIPFAVWLLVGFFAALPRELEEAAMVDGCSPLGALTRVILPLSTPGMVAAGLFIFIVAWNDFLYAFLFASGEGVKTLPVVMRSFVRGESGVFWGTVMASTAFTTFPVAAAFLFFQKYLIGGLSAGAVKG
jgi:multiple sugar transport system permease protein